MDKVGRSLKFKTTDDLKGKEDGNYNFIGEYFGTQLRYIYMDKERTLQSYEELND